MKHELIRLSYSYDALEPYMSKETLEYHHGKHHQTYVNKLNELVKDTEYENMTLEQIILRADGPIFNNAAQIFNHDFFWKSISPKESKVSFELENLIVKTFGSMYDFKKEFIQKATTHFGSGWVWLVLDKEGIMHIITTTNAGNPLTSEFIPLLTCDVWEHAYYIDYRNARPSYLEEWWKIINWKFVSNNLLKVKELGSLYFVNDGDENSDVYDYVKSASKK